MDENINDKKIAFLFGAGAEGKDNFNLPSGIDFIKDIFFSNNDYITGALSKFFSGQYFDKYKYRRNQYIINLTILKMFVKQKSLTNKEYFITYNPFVKKLLSNEDFSEINEIHHLKEDISKIVSFDNSKAVKVLKNILSENEDGSNDKNYNFVYDLFETYVDEENKTKFVIDFNIGFSGILDKYFHTIINPCKFSEINFSKIFNYYWNCYFSILQNIIKLDKVYFEDYIDKDKVDIYKIINNIANFTKLLYEFEEYKNKEDTYYQLIKKAINDNHLECSGILTTNYYKFADIISDSVVYLNGSLNLFEIPESFDVHDLIRYNQVLENDKLFFPFIFGQSFVKPIIHKKQIDTFNEAYSVLENSDILVILGFNLNEDDNHINSLLKSFVDNGGKIIKVQHKNKSKKESRDAHKKIRCDESAIEYCIFENYNNQKVVDEIFKKVNELMEER